MPVSASALSNWHLQPQAFDRLVPPWQSIEVLSRPPSIENGAELLMAMKMGPASLKWLALHRGVEPGHQFIDEQKKGPFYRWVHTHTFDKTGSPQSSLLVDSIDYQLPLSPVSDLFAGWAVRRMLRRMFAFRHQRTFWDLMRHDQYADEQRLRIAITGATGLIGTELTAFLETGGHTVHRISRSSPSRDTDIQWTPREDRLDADRLEGVDAVIHLAGENLAGGSWTEERKQRILKSREAGTSLVARTLASLEDPPEVLISASAVGFYGDTGDEVADESTPPGDTFLSEVCQRWEQAAQPAADSGIRVVHPRLGVVLSPKGGALAEMLTPFKFGVGGRIGSGDQWMPWVTLDDVVGALNMCLFNSDIDGPINVTSPNPVPNHEFVDTLGDVLNRPTILPLPAFAVRMLFGEMGEETLLQGQRVDPAILREHDFDFAHPRLKSALEFVLGRTEQAATPRSA
jgi:uncharacterized protein (TIGR01777 family)